LREALIQRGVARNLASFLVFVVLPSFLSEGQLSCLSPKFAATPVRISTQFSTMELSSSRLSNDGERAGPHMNREKVGGLRVV